MNVWTQWMALHAAFTRRRRLPLASVLLLIALNGPKAYPQHSHSSSQSELDSPAWSELQQSMQSMHESMSLLKSTGDNDGDFVRMMIPHHQAALDMAKAELMHGHDPQMRRLAQEIITDQESEIELMNTWLKQHTSQK